MALLNCSDHLGQFIDGDTAASRGADCLKAGERGDAVASCCIRHADHLQMTHLYRSIRGGSYLKEELHP